jgi:hypothetical protein
MFEESYEKKEEGNQNIVCVDCGNIDGDEWNLKHSGK